MASAQMEMRCRARALLPSDGLVVVVSLPSTPTPLRSKVILPGERPGEVEVITDAAKLRHQELVLPSTGQAAW